MTKDEILHLFLEHRTMLYAFVNAMVRNPHGAEDVFQETSMVLFREAERFQGGDFPAWARSIARNRIREYFRKQRQTMPLSEAAEEALASAHDEVPNDWWRSRREALARCLDAVEDKIRQIVDLYYGQFLSMDQIAQTLGRPQASIRVILFRVRKKLKVCADQRLKAEA